MDSGASSTDSLVVFLNSQKAPGRGTLLHLTRNVVVFEVYNPYSIVQLSEVLTDLRIMRGERTIYTGRAVVSNLVATGLMVIVSATLVDPWADLEGLAPGEGLREEVEGFVKDWEAGYSLQPSYQLAVSNVSAFLAELSSWLEQLEVATEGGRTKDPAALQREFVLEVEAPLGPKVDELFSIFEREAARVPPEQAVVHKAFARRELHPLMLCSPFVHRTFTKPLGYAGDYEMVNMILGDVLQGGTTYAKIVNSFNLRTATAAAHRNRIVMLEEHLKAESRRAAGESRPCRVLNIGCGPAAEVQRFIKCDPLSERCRFSLLDFNQETLEYARSRIAEATREAARCPGVEFIHKSIHDLLKEAGGKRGAQEAAYDLVYCAGLFDYLSDRICGRLLGLFHQWTVPGGLLVATNVHRQNPVRYYMEHVLEWHLNYRDEAEMAALAADMAPLRTCTDPTGVNVFLEIRKPETPGGG